MSRVHLWIAPGPKADVRMRAGFALAVARTLFTLRWSPLLAVPARDSGKPINANEF